VPSIQVQGGMSFVYHGPVATVIVPRTIGDGLRTDRREGARPPTMRE
jgi:hypothetical protein